MNNRVNFNKYFVSFLEISLYYLLHIQSQAVTTMMVMTNIGGTFKRTIESGHKKLQCFEFCTYKHIHTYTHTQKRKLPGNGTRNLLEARMFDDPINARKNALGLDKQAR